MVSRRGVGAGALAVVLALCAVGAAVATFPPPPQDSPYCNVNPKPIPALSAASKAMNPTLELVNIFIRHGDRTDAGPQCWPNDEAVWGCNLKQLQHSTTQADAVGDQAVGRTYSLQFVPGMESEKGCAGLGQLTERGFKQHITNGQHLRDAYITDAGLFPKTYEEDPALFFLRADNIRRTQMSGQALFTGMYPEAASSGDNTNTFPFWTRDEQVDDILPNAYNCPLLKDAVIAVLESAPAQVFIADVEATLKRISQQVGFSVTSLGTMFDCLHTHICHSFPIPAGITESDFDVISNYTWFEGTLNYGYNNSRVARLGMGPLIAEMYGNMKAILNGTVHPTRFWLYSGHDTGPILPMLSAYHVDYRRWCPYASLISVEMYKADTPSGHAVRFVYNGEAIVLDGCGAELCDYDDFARFTEEIIPSEAECGKPIVS